MMIQSSFDPNPCLPPFSLPNSTDCIYDLCYTLVHVASARLVEASRVVCIRIWRAQLLVREEFTFFIRALLIWSIKPSVILNKHTRACMVSSIIIKWPRSTMMAVTIYLIPFEYRLKSQSQRLLYLSSLTVNSDLILIPQLCFIMFSDHNHVDSYRLQCIMQ